MMGCKKCSMICGVGLLILGILFILVDFGVWSFWNISWWSALLIWFGIGSWGMSKCANCQAIRTGSVGKKKK